LESFVREPKWVIENRAESVIVVIDEMGVWLKLKGDEKIYISDREQLTAAQAKAIKKATKNADTQEEKDSALEEAGQHMDENPNAKAQTDASYSSAGDKYRMTKLTVSAVKHWFDLSCRPEPMKPKQVLVAPCKEPCRLNNISKEKTWVTTWSYQNADGTYITHMEGTSAKGYLDGYVYARDQHADTAWQDTIEVFGQPKAYVDQQTCINVWEFLRESFADSPLLVSCDSLGTCWSECAMLRAWRYNILVFPYAPGVTSFLQETDTHEHFQERSCYREVSRELHFALEHWAKQKNIDVRMDFGPWEFLQVLRKGQLEFRERNPLTPLLGLVQTQILIYRPSADGHSEIIDDCEAPTTKALFDELKLVRMPPSRGVSAQLARDRILINQKEWHIWVPPSPDWDILNRKTPNYLFQDDLPQMPGDDDFVHDMDLKDLQLTEHQKAMLLPVDHRSANVIMPGSISSRVRTKNKLQQQRKSRWANKFKGVFMGKWSAKWKARVAKLGLTAAMAALEHEAGPTSNLNPYAKTQLKGRGPGRGRGKSAGRGQAPPPHSARREA
jgi:hypothetical protein